MPQIDRLLSVMMSQRANALRLNEHELAELEIAGVARPVTKTALTSAQVIALVREIAPAESAAEPPRETPARIETRRPFRLHRVRKR